MLLNVYCILFYIFITKKSMYLLCFDTFVFIDNILIINIYMVNRFRVEDINLDKANI